MLTAFKDSALHEAVRQSCAQVVSPMVQGLPSQSLDQLLDAQQNNPLHVAALVGRESADSVSTMEDLLRAHMNANSPGVNHILDCTALHTASTPGDGGLPS